MHSIHGVNHLAGWKDSLVRLTGQAGGTDHGRRGEGEPLAGEPAVFAGALASSMGAAVGQSKPTNEERGQAHLHPSGHSAWPAGLPAVLEKLAARSAERPEAKGLGNAVLHIRQNLERHGWVAPAATEEVEASATGTGMVEEPTAPDSIPAVIDENGAAAGNPPVVSSPVRDVDDAAGASTAAPGRASDALS